MKLKLDIAPDIVAMMAAEKQKSFEPKKVLRLALLPP
jgi:hypothetical protein